jgi:undecaprenyl-diphosphatase
LSEKAYRRGRDRGLAGRLRDLDRALFGAAFRWKWGPATVVLRLFTVLGTAGFLWGVVAAGAFALKGFAPWVDLLVPWAAVALAWTVAEGAKYFFDRARPFVYDTEIAPLIKTPSSSSFPSGHSATAAAGALSLSVLYPPFAPFLVLAGVLVVLSRVYLGVHYPFDVLAGSLIGVLAGVLVLAVGSGLA